MIAFYIAVPIFAIMLIAPLMLGLYELRRGESKTLFIDLKRKRDVRFFARSFAGMIEKQLPGYQPGDVIKMSKEEHAVTAETLEAEDQTCDAVVLALNEEFVSEFRVNFEKEIYAKHGAMIDEGSYVRAVCSKQHLIMADNTEVGRWIDSQGPMSVYDHCDLGTSATTADMMTIGHNCKFKRLFAPVIMAGQYPEELRADDFHYNFAYCPERRKKLRRNMKYIGRNSADDDGRFYGTVLSKHDVFVIDGISVYGDISSQKNVSIMAGAVVYGNVFAEGNVHVENGARVLGNVFSQGSIYIDRDAVVGTKGNIVSVLCRESVYIGKNTIIYGFVNAEQGGYCCRNYDAKARPKDDAGRSLYYKAPSLRRMKVCDFTSVNYATFDIRTLRKNEDLEKVVFPEGLKKLPRSILFECANVKEVVLPRSLVEIGDFAFCGLEKLEKINISACVNLKKIGQSAFRDCGSLRRISIPDACRRIGYAAFLGCESLESVQISPSNELHHVGKYAFSNCPALDKAFAENISKLEADTVFMSVETGVQDDDDAFYDGIDRHAEAATTQVTGMEDGAKPKEFLSREEKRRIRYSKSLNKYKGFRRGKLAMIALAVFAVLVVLLLVYNFVFSQFLEDTEEGVFADIFRFTNPRIQMLDKDELSDEIVEETSEFIFFEDRVLEKYIYDEQELDEVISDVNAVAAALPESVNKYYMMVPGRISSEPDYAEHAGDRTPEAMSKIYGGLDASITTLDVYDALIKSEDYVFFRTEQVWTARGAYIGVQAFAEAAGITPVPLEEYNVSATSRLLGSYNYIENTDISLSAYKDAIEIFTLGSNVNSQRVTTISPKNPLTDVVSATISKQRGGESTFIGSYVSHSIIEGDVANGKAVMVIANSSGNILAPFLTPYYENVLFVKPKYFSGDLSTLLTFFDRYNVTDVLIIESMPDLNSTKFGIRF